jgi:Leucine-rich repeat (LRR) protein
MIRTSTALTHGRFVRTFEQLIFILDHIMFNFLCGLCQSGQFVFDQYSVDMSNHRSDIQAKHRSVSQDGTVDAALGELKSAGASPVTIELVKSCIENKSTDLKVTDDALTTLPVSVLQHLGHLENFVLKGVQISSLPEDFGDYLPALTGLYLDGMSLSALPESLPKLSCLKELGISNCGKLPALPKDIGALKRLEFLSIRGCPSMDLIPESIGELSRLQTCALEGMPLKTLPESFTSLPNLEELRMRKLPNLVAMPKDMAKLSTLKELFISSCDMIGFPECVTDLPNLKNLGLGSDGLESIPESIGKLTELRYLSLANNKLTSLPDSISGLRKLREFWVHGNRFKELPSCIAQLPPRCDVFTGYVDFSREALEAAYQMLWNNDGPCNLRGFIEQRIDSWDYQEKLRQAAKKGNSINSSDSPDYEQNNHQMSSGSEYENMPAARNARP